jgi:hypothetical protein
MRKVFPILLLAALASVVAELPLEAQRRTDDYDRRVLVANDRSSPMTRLYGARTTTSDWEENILHEPIAPGPASWSTSTTAPEPAISTSAPSSRTGGSSTSGTSTSVGRASGGRWIEAAAIGDGGGAVAMPRNSPSNVADIGHSVRLGLPHGQGRRGYWLFKMEL